MSTTTSPATLPTVSSTSTTMTSTQSSITTTSPTTSDIATTPVTPPPVTTSSSSSEATSTETSTSSLTSSSAAPAPPPPPPPTTPNHSTTRIISSGTGGIVTVTSIIESTPTNSFAPTQSGGSSTPKAFFQNTAAVAGVFTVVGLIVLALFFVCVTNAIRRRRAQQFDRDVAEAAATAADAQLPVFDDDDTAYGGGGGFTRYSDNSHGTYGQPPMTHNGGGSESYGMSEIHPYDPFATSAGAAGVGVGAAVQRARSRKEIRPDGGIGPSGMAGYDMYDVGAGVTPGYGEHSSPYPVFSGPPAQQHPMMYDSAPGGRYALPGNPGLDLMDAAGLSAAGAGAAHVAGGPSVHTQQTGYSDLSRNKSQGNRNLGPDSFHGTGSSGQDPVAGESYAAHYQPGYQYQPPTKQGDSALNVGGEDAYGGYVGPRQQQFPSHGTANQNPQSVGIPTGQEGSGSNLSDGEQDPDTLGEGKHVVGDDQASLRDEEDYELERGKRVLKVANE